MRLALTLLLLTSCSANSADGTVRGAREEFLVRGHVEDGDSWNEVAGLATVAKWEQGLGPSTFGWGFELGWETQGFVNSNPLIALIGTAQVDLGEEEGGWSLHADLHRRMPFLSDNDQVPGGADAYEAE